MYKSIASNDVPWKAFLSLLFSRVGKVEISIAATVAIIVVIWQAIMAAKGIETYPLYGGFINTRFLFTVLSIIMLSEIVVLLIRHRPSSPINFLKSDIVVRRTIARLVPGMVVAVCLGFFMPTFSQVKSSIPAFNDYSWDATFIGWDLILHGSDPWRVLQPLLGHPAITATLGHLYHVWFALIHLGPLCFALYVSDNHLRLRFFLGYFLSWTIVGMITAIILASVGPVFLEPMLGDAHFSDQLAYLHSANAAVTNPVIEVQQMLLEWSERGELGLGRGITAMPSMHVALTTLYVFAAWQIDRRLGILFAIYWVLIMVGSVHLAYHYAVDGYVSVILVSLIWFATKPLARMILRSENGGDANASKMETSRQFLAKK